MSGCMATLSYELEGGANSPQAHTVAWFGDMLSGAYLESFTPSTRQCFMCHSVVTNSPQNVLTAILKYCYV